MKLKQNPLQKKIEQQKRFQERSRASQMEYQKKRRALPPKKPEYKPFLEKHKKFSNIGPSKFKNQVELFQYKWDHSDHRSELSGEFIEEPKTRNFAHLLPKGTYPKWRMDINNIVLVASIDEHHELDRLAVGHKHEIEQQLLQGNKPRLCDFITPRK